MDLRRLRYFLAVAEELNFTRAARRLGISQPPLSLQIRELEKELGTPLLRRRARGIELTGAGKLMLEEARRILGEMERIKTDVRRVGRGETGRLNIGSGGATYFHPLAPEIIREFQRRYPEIVVKPEGGVTAMLIARLHAGVLDAAFIWPPVEAPGLELEHLATVEPIVVLPRRHRLAGASRVSLADLAGDKLVVFAREANPAAHDNIIALCQEAGFNPALGPAAPQVLDCIPLVAAGLGFSIVPDFLGCVHASGVIYLPLSQQRPLPGIGLAYRRDDRSPAVKNFIAVVRHVKNNAAAISEDRRRQPHSATM